jgi:hypothetical protein
MRLLTGPHSSIIFFKITVLALLFIFPCHPARAQDATISDLAAVNSDTHLLVYLTVKDCFTEEMLTGVHNGIPATFTYLVDIYETRKMWPDKKIFSYSFDRTLSFDNLKEQYTVISSEKNRSLTTENLSEAKQLIAEVVDLKTAQLDHFKPDTLYRIEVKAKLEKKTLPWYYQYLFPFSSLWDFETGWATLEFSIN